MQLGIATSRQIKAAGVSGWTVRRRVASGAWRWLNSGVLKLAPGTLSLDQRDLAALLAAGPGAALSHHTAARRLGLEVPATPDVHLTVDAARTVGHLPGTVAHRSQTFEQARRISRGPFTLTPLGRTVLDLAEVLDPGWLRAAVDSALRLGQWNRKWMLLALEEHGAGRHGAGVLRSLLDAPEDAGPTDSALESLAMELGLATGRKPRRQVPVRTNQGFTVRLDFAWPEVRFGVELDGYATHAQRGPFRRDRSRDRALFELGWEVSRYTWHEVTSERQYVIDQLARSHARCQLTVNARWFAVTSLAKVK